MPLEVVPDGQKRANSSQYSLEEALDTLHQNGEPIVELRLQSGQYYLSSPIEFLGTVLASEVRIIGESMGSVTISWSEKDGHCNSSLVCRQRRLDEPQLSSTMHEKGMIGVENGAVHVNLTNLTLTHDGDILLPLLSISNGKLTMDSCNVSGSRASGLLVTGGVVRISDSGRADDPYGSGGVSAAGPRDVASG